MEGSAEVGALLEGRGLGEGDEDLAGEGGAAGEGEGEAGADGLAVCVGAGRAAATLQAHCGVVGADVGVGERAGGEGDSMVEHGAPVFPAESGYVCVSVLWVRWIAIRNEIEEARKQG